MEEATNNTTTQGGKVLKENAKLFCSVLPS